MAGIDDNDGRWFSCSKHEDEDEQERGGEVQRQEKGAPQERVEGGVEAATTSPPAVGPFTMPMGSNGAPQQEHVEEGEEVYKLKAWFKTYASGHVWGSLREMEVESLEDLVLDAEGEDTGFSEPPRTFKLSCWLFESAQGKAGARWGQYPAILLVMN